MNAYYLTVKHVIELHENVIAQSGGSAGVRDMGGVDAAVHQPMMTYGRVELYPTIVEKAAAIGFAIIKNHPFVDGNKRTGHAAMELFLLANGYEINASIDEQENLILKLASGELDRDEFEAWLREHVVESQV